MTRDEALAYLADNADRTFFGDVYERVQRIANYRNPPSIYFWGSESECMALYHALNGGVREMSRPYNGNKFQWWAAGLSSEIIAELKPLLEEGNAEARRRVAFCR